jgi:stage II sporulation protein D
MRRLLIPTAALALVALGTSAACGASDPAVPVPDQATITITGHGWGHGHGMSQYGAKGAAEAGESVSEIVGFYYPGTTPSQFSGHVKVLITADNDNTTVVLPRAGLNVRDLASKQKWKLPDNGAKSWRLAVSPGGVSVVSYLTDSWHRYLALTGDGEFTAWGQPITLVLPSGSTVAYRGALRSLRPASDAITRDTVNVLRIDNYVKGVIPREMPASWSPAAVQAQAIAARTYASYEMQHPLSTTYQICDTTSCQVYGGYTAEDSRSNAAVDATAGQVLTYDGEPAFTQFSSSNGGWSAAGSVPYLVAKEDDFEAESGNPNLNWTVKVDAAVIERRFPRLGNLKGITISRNAAYADGGRASSLVLVGSKDGAKTSVTVSGDAFRSVMGLKSTWFDLTAAAK